VGDIWAVRLAHNCDMVVGSHEGHFFITLYCFIGFVMAIGTGCALGMAIASIIALFKITVRAENILLLAAIFL
jgi:hypothetical protein